MAVAPRSQSSSHGLQIIGLLAVIGIGLVVWAALAVQAAIVGQREDARDARLREELSGSAAVTAVAPAAVESFPMAVSDQAKATPFDATLPPASLAPRCTMRALPRSASTTP